MIVYQKSCLKLLQNQPFCPKTGMISPYLIMDFLYDGSSDEQCLTVMKLDQKKSMLDYAQTSG